MLRILGSPRKMCGGLTRRDFLHVGGLGALGIGLADALRWTEAQAADAAGTFGKSKAVILCFPYGSPPQHETFDPKPEAPAEIRGDYSEAIATNVPGLYIGHGLPKLAQVMDRGTVIRSMSHPFPVHGVAYATTGIPNYNPRLEVNPRDPAQWPYVGSCVDYVFERRARRESATAGLSRSASAASPGSVPRNLVLPWKMNSQNGGIATAGPYAAFLGPAYDPVVTEFVGEATRVVKKVRPAGGTSYDVRDPFAGVKPDCRFVVSGATLLDDLTLDRLDKRRSLLEQFDAARTRLDANLSTRGYDRFQHMALSLLTDARLRDALDVRREPAPLREQYGMTLFGQACLTARRLVEAGSKFVTVFWDEVGPINTDWDTHWRQKYRLTDRLLPGFDAGFSALLTDLDQRGMLDETLVLWMSEHGRTPKFNATAGRDHWSRAYSIVMAGGGVPRGRVVGGTDSIAGDVTSAPISPKDILATVYYLLGIDPETRVPDRLGQLRRISGEGNVRPELL